MVTHFGVGACVGESGDKARTADQRAIKIDNVMRKLADVSARHKPRRLAPRQSYPREGPAHSGTIVVHMPLPGILSGLIDERRVKACRGGVLEQERDGIPDDGAAPGTLGRERRRGGVIHPHTHA